MNKLAKLMIISVLLFQTVLSGAEAERIGAILKLKGKVEIKHSGESSYTPAYVGQILLDGDWIRTSMDQFAALIFLDGTQIKLSEEAELELKSQRISAREQNTELFLEKGEIFSKVQKQKKSDFTIATPVSVAAVKGTQFDLTYDQNEKTSELFVFEGSVEFANEMGRILAREMTYSRATLEERPSKAKKLSPKNLPDWQENTDAEWGFKLIPEKTGAQPVNTPLRIMVQAVNMESGQNANSYSGKADIFAQGDIKVSTDGNNWGDKCTLTLQGGKSQVYVQASKSGESSIVINAENMEGRKLDMDFTVSKLQRSRINTRLNRIMEKKSLGDVSEQISGKDVKSSKISGTSSDVDEVLQKVDTGEFEIVDIITVQNADGSVSVKIKVQPRKK